MAVSLDSKLYLVRRCSHCMVRPRTAVHLDRCTPRYRMYSRLADAHGKRAKPEIIEYEKREYEKWCRRAIQAVNLDISSDESSSDQDDGVELDTAGVHEGDHFDDVDDGSDREEERTAATGQAIVAVLQIDPQTRPCAPGDGTPFGRDYFLIEDTVPLPKNKQISEEDLI
eukprot:6809385-Pyramimonas_sp.AAC.1